MVKPLETRYPPATMPWDQFEDRKKDHIRYALDSRVQAIGRSGFDRIQLSHEALPELDFREVDLNSNSLGRFCQTPFYVSGMTAGHTGSVEINRVLAEACQEKGWALGVGSQRRDFEALRDGKFEERLKDEWRGFRDDFPDLKLYGNIGISQVVADPTASAELISRIADEMNLQAMAIHLNALQEVIQPEGTPSFRGGLNALATLTAALNVPVIIKETGCGFSDSTLRRLMEIPFAALDVSGLGGTHWGRIEGMRSPEGSLHEETAQTFSHWGRGTADSIIAARHLLETQEVWASGGMRTGLDAAKAISIGANAVGFAQPALKAALSGKDNLLRWMELKEYELRVAMFCSGSRTIHDLNDKGAVIGK